MRIVVFGVGNTGQYFLKKIFDRENDEIVVAVDNNECLWGTDVNGFNRVVSPTQITQFCYDYIVITSIHKSSILNQIANIVDVDKVIDVEDYERIVYTRKVYRDKYKKENFVLSNVFSGRKVVYTAITGEYDCLQEPISASDDTLDYICFTNNRKLSSNKWKVVYVSDDSLGDMYLARKLKLFPNDLLGDYDVSIWVDGKFQVTGDFANYITEYQKASPVLCFPHFSRNCLYEEAARCIVDGIGYKPDILRQLSYYQEQSYPCDQGLYETGCIVRRHNDDRVISLMKSWWEEIMRFSYRDQISFPYVCWKAGFYPDICDQNIYKNKWLNCKRNYSKAFGRL